MGALGSSVEGCSEFMGSSMSQVWSNVEAGLRDSDVSVRKAAFTTVGRLCGWLQDSCREKHATLVPVSVLAIHKEFAYNYFRSGPPWRS